MTHDAQRRQRRLSTVPRARASLALLSLVTLAAIGPGCSSGENGSPDAESSAQTTSATKAAGTDILPEADLADEASRPAASRQPLDGFDERAFRFIGTDGPITDWFCGLLALTDPAREQGLMNQTDLRGYDAMLFEWPSDVSFGFWMKNTLIPLDIAWYDDAGAEVDRAEMDPCPADVADCPISTPTSQYRIALETDLGHLAELGSTANTRPGIEFATRCAAA